MYLIDTNILIYYLAKDENIMAFVDSLADNPLYVSDISVIEVLSYPFSEQELEKVMIFLSNFSWLPVTREIVLQTAKNRRQKKTKTPDAIIGATALCHRLTIVTNNTKDFVHLPIAMINPLD